ncbi:hypothetical protein Rhsp01_43460 [Rhizobium sp. NBRC 114257]|uniref:Uncharacterized protein n=1 Tax=Rhizobium dioscoreae TaxID=2653122 RepID=A0ABQ0Z981_9HYPH|nr:hypothetical protein RsS93_47250 [Rhizobium dioscoreae]GLU83170.1 hypothetical protein Rhsp01_43460 [Rhizobium sp. NBRC 114257]
MGSIIGGVIPSMIAFNVQVEKSNRSHRLTRVRLSVGDFFDTVSFFGQRFAHPPQGFFVKLLNAYEFVMGL